MFNKEGIKGFASFVQQFLLPFVGVLLIVLSIQIYNLPSKMALEMALKNGQQKTDTVTIIKTETAKLQTNNNFLFVSGQLDKKSYKLIDNYAYNTDYPKEIFSGYITKITTVQGGKYYVWTKDELNNGDLSITMHGWFFTDGVSSFQEIDPMDKKEKSDYLELIYPVVESNFE